MMNVFSRSLISSVSISLLFILGISTVFAKTYYPSGFYVFAGGGAGLLDSDNLTIIPENTGSSLTKDSFNDEQLIMNVGAGYKLADWPFRFALAYTHRGEIDETMNPIINGEPYTGKASLKSETFMFNSYFDIPCGSAIVFPFVNLGLGYNRNKANIDALDTGDGAEFDIDKDKGGFAWQAGIGVNFKLFDHVTLDLGFSHVDLGKAQWGPWVDEGNPWGFKTNDVSSNDLYLNFNFFFGDQTPQRAPSLIND